MSPELGLLLRALLRVRLDEFNWNMGFVEVLVLALVHAVVDVLVPLCAWHLNTHAVQALGWHSELFATEVRHDASAKGITHDVYRGTNSIARKIKISQPLYFYSTYNLKVGIILFLQHPVNCEDEGNVVDWEAD